MIRLIRSCVILGVAFAAGCGQSAAPPKVDGTPFLLAEEPAGALSVVDARKDAKDGEAVLLVGRIGGSVKPFVAGRATFTIVDSALKPCAPDCGCKTPWDYCCDTDALPKSTATVKVVAADATPVAADARALLGVKELQTVVVRGTAKRDSAGNLTVLATGVFVRK